MSNEVKVWSWAELTVDHVWLRLEFNPDDKYHLRFNATVLDADGVEGYAEAQTALDACAVAHHRQKQNRILFDKKTAQ